MFYLYLSPPPFSFVKTIEKVIRLCTVLIFFFLSGSFEDMGPFHVFQLSFDGGGTVISTYNRYNIENLFFISAYFQIQSG